MKILVLLDDHYARNKAKQFDLMVTGTLGILLLAYHERMIKDLHDEIEKLKAVGFRISNGVLKHVLSKGDPNGKG
jgi:predicted nucleic acid-binding protein